MQFTYLSPFVISCLFLPSKDTHAEFLLDLLSIIFKVPQKRGKRVKVGHVNLLTSSSTPDGTTMDLKESECGQMGVTIMQGTLGCTMLAPAASE